MTVTWLDWFSWTRCRLQRDEFKRAGRKLPASLKTPESVMRILSAKTSAKALEVRHSGETMPEYERFLLILFPYFVSSSAHDPGALNTPVNMRIEREAVQPLLDLQLGVNDVAGWVEICREHPLTYIDFPMNSWLISDTAQVSAIFIDNGIVEDGEIGIFFDDEPLSTVSVILSQKNKRSKRRLVWQIGRDHWHDDVAGKDSDDLQGEVPTAAAMLATTGLDPIDFCRRVEQMIAATYFQRRSLRAAQMDRHWVGRLPSDPARQAAFMRQDKGSDVRSLFRIERIGIVPEEARRRLPDEAMHGARGPLLSPVWVRAHWRDQRHGPGLLQTKRILIEAHRKGPENGLLRHPMSLIEA